MTVKKLGRTSKQHSNVLKRTKQTSCGTESETQCVCCQSTVHRRRQEAKHCTLDVLRQQFGDMPHVSHLANGSYLRKPCFDAAQACLGKTEVDQEVMDVLTSLLVRCAGKEDVVTSGAGRFVIESVLTRRGCNACYVDDWQARHLDEIMESVPWPDGAHFLAAVKYFFMQPLKTPRQSLSNWQLTEEMVTDAANILNSSPSPPGVRTWLAGDEFMRTFAVLYCPEKRHFFAVEFLHSLSACAHSLWTTDWGAALILGKDVPEVMIIDAYRDFSAMQAGGDYSKVKNRKILTLMTACYT